METIELFKTRLCSESLISQSKQLFDEMKNRLCGPSEAASGWRTRLQERGTHLWPEQLSCGSIPEQPEPSPPAGRRGRPSGPAQTRRDDHHAPRRLQLRLRAPPRRRPGSSDLQNNRRSDHREQSPSYQQGASGTGRLHLPQFSSRISSFHWSTFRNDSGSEPSL